jgi:hypothetical protein
MAEASRKPAMKPLEAIRQGGRSVAQYKEDAAQREFAQLNAEHRLGSTILDAIAHIAVHSMARASITQVREVARERGNEFANNVGVGGIICHLADIGLVSVTSGANGTVKNIRMTDLGWRFTEVERPLWA